ARQRDDRHRSLGDELPGHALDGDGHDLLGAAIGFLPGLGLDVPNPLRGIVAGLVDHLLHERALRLVARHAGRLLELLPDAVDQLIVLGTAAFELPLALPLRLFARGDLALAGRERLELAVDALLLLRDALLGHPDLAALLARLLLPFRLRLDEEIFR